MPGKGGDRLREADAVGGLGVEVGVMAELVPREEELVRMAIVDGEGEGAADVLERARAHRPERGEHDLGIARLRGDAGLLGEDLALEEVAAEDGGEAVVAGEPGASRRPRARARPRGRLLRGGSVR